MIWEAYQEYAFMGGSFNYNSTSVFTSAFWDKLEMVLLFVFLITSNMGFSSMYHEAQWDNGDPKFLFSIFWGAFTGCAVCGSIVVLVGPLAIVVYWLSLLLLGMIPSFIYLMIKDKLIVAAYQKMKIAVTRDSEIGNEGRY